MCANYDFNKLKEEINRLSKIIASICSTKIFTGPQKKRTKTKDKELERTKRLEEDLYMRCSHVLDELKDNTDEDILCTATEIENKHKLLGYEKVRRVTEFSKRFNCEDCFIFRGSHIHIYLKKFTRWIMDNAYKHRFLLKKNVLFGK